MPDSYQFTPIDTEKITTLTQSWQQPTSYIFGKFRDEGFYVLVEKQKQNDQNRWIGILTQDEPSQIELDDTQTITLSCSICSKVTETGFLFETYRNIAKTDPLFQETQITTESTQTLLCPYCKDRFTRLEQNARNHHKEIILSHEI